MKLSVYLLFFVSLAVAGEPNYVRITICKVGKKSGADNDLVTTTYSDGLGRHIQAKVKIDDSHDRTVCVFYDNAGRRDTSTNAFIDDTRPGSYLEGTFGKINAPDSPLRTIYNDSRAFSYSRYAQEPQSRIVEQNGPGEQFEHNPAKLWRLGVTKEKITIPTDARDVEFDNGLVTTDMNGNDFDDELDYLSSNPAFVSPMFFLTVLKDARGNYSQELKDLFGNSLATCAMDSGNMIVAKYSYNVHGNLLTEAAPKPTDTIADASYTYNALGQLINKATPDGGSFAYAYTLSGQLASDTSYGPGNAVYRIRRYTYDNMGRLVLTELKNDNDPAHDNWTAVIHNYYDDVDLLNSDAARYNIQPTLLSSLANLKGRLVAGIAVNKVNGLTYYICDLFSYDDEGRIGKKVKIVPGLPCQTVSYSYDLQDKVLSDTTVCGSQNIIMAYQYDGEGRLEHVIHVSNSDKTVASYSYDDLGRPNIKTLAIGSGEQMEYRYNVRGWVNYIGAVSGNHLTNKFSEVINTYETNGNILNALYRYDYYNSSSTGNNEIDLTYSYDHVNRLTGVAQDGATNYCANYSYDVLGRFRSKTEGSDTRAGYTYYSGTNRLKKTGATANQYYYDKHGNMVLDVNKKMTIKYDWRDMPSVFSFYSEMPATPPLSDSRGTLTVNPDTYFASANKDIVSQVMMLYDAYGNRVLKIGGR